MNYIGFLLRHVLDREGRREVAQGLTILVASIALTWLVSSYCGMILAAAVFILGLDISCHFFDNAFIGSIYRQRNGKLSKFYLERKQYLNERFKTLYGADFTVDEMPSSDNPLHKFLIEKVKIAKEAVCVPTHVGFNTTRVFRIPRATALKLSKTYSNNSTCEKWTKV